MIRNTSRTDTSWKNNVGYAAAAIVIGLVCGTAATGQWLGLALLAFAILGFVSFARPAFGLYVLAIAFPSYSLQIAALGDASPFKILTGLVFVSWLLRFLVVKERLPRLTNVDIAVVLYTCTLLTSAMANGTDPNSLLTDLQIVMLYFMVRSALKTFPEITRFLVLTLLGQFGIGALCTYQRKTKQYWWPDLPGMDHYPHRASGLGQCNETGGRLAFNIPIALTLLGESTVHILARGFVVMGTGLMLFGLYATSSRGGIFTFFFCVLQWSALWFMTPSAGQQEEKAKAQTRRWHHIAMGVVILLGLFVFFKRHVSPDLNWEFERRWNLTMERDLKNPLADEAGTGRMGIWKKALHKIAERPIFGYGPKARVAGVGFTHNTVLEVGIQSGVLAVVPFSLAHMLALLGLWRARRRFLLAGSMKEARMVNTLFVTICGFMFAGLQGNYSHDKDNWCYLALASTIGQMRGDRESLLGLDEPSLGSGGSREGTPLEASRRLAADRGEDSRAI